VHSARSVIEFRLTSKMMLPGMTCCDSAPMGLTSQH
jgi:hypothetical protein